MKIFVAIVAMWVILLSVSGCENRTAVPPSASQEVAIAPSASPEDNMLQFPLIDGMKSKDMPNITGNYTQLQPTSKIFDARLFGEMLEFDGFIICSSYNPVGTDFQSDYTIEAFDTVTGKSLFYRNAEHYANFKDLYRIEKSKVMDGYDYRLVFDGGIVYRSSTDHNKEFVYNLPSSIQSAIIQSPAAGSTYDVNKQYVIRTGVDGVWRSDINGENAVCILSNDLLHKDYPDNASLTYANPRFILEDSKVVAGVFQLGEGNFYDAVIYDSTLEKIEYRLGFTPPDYPIYPIQDRFVASKGSLGPVLLDAQTGQMTDYRVKELNFPTFSTFDYKDIVVAQYENMELQGFKAYVCTIDSPSDRSKEILSVVDEGTVNILGISEQYIVLGDVESGWAAIAKYRA